MTEPAICIGIGVIAALALSGAASAQTPPASPVRQALPDRTAPGASADRENDPFHRLFARWQSVEVSPAVGSVTVSRAGDALGRPVFADRRTFSGSDRMVAFSMRPPVPAGLRAVTSLPGISLPNNWPMQRMALTSGFGYRRHPLLGVVRAHTGVDLAAPIGTPVFATSDGLVSTAGWQGGYGLLVALDHGGALQTRYGHLSQLAVAPGQTVRKGEVLGYVGSTGRSTGPHLHYEVRANGYAVDPLSRRR